ncbi:MAG: putative Ig domain-containing protein, partial [Planctomycetota bacterium]
MSAWSEKGRYGVLAALAIVAMAFFCAGDARATTYEVGPGQAYANIGDVPIEDLTAGDTVRIHYRATPYKEKFALGCVGTQSQPVTIQGVPGPGGELPVLDGQDATTRLELATGSEQRGLITMQHWTTVPPTSWPEYIIFENLEIKNASIPYTFTDDSGATQSYVNSSAAIWGAAGKNITIRNCHFHDCGNGIFTYTADDGADAWTESWLIEGNYVHDCGNAGRIYEHTSYTETYKITFQYNHYGPPRGYSSGSHGNGLKDRSAGTVIRFNWLEGGNRILDLVDAEDSGTLAAKPEYEKTYIYGNVMIEFDDPGNRQVVHFGHDAYMFPREKGYFYNNTLVSYRSGYTTLFMQNGGASSVMDCRNNIVYVTAAGNNLEISNDSDGDVDIRNNWFKTGYRLVGGSGGTVNDYGGHVVGSSPGFVNEGGEDFHLAESSLCRDAGTTLHADCSSYPVDMQYVKHLESEARPNDGTLDIGSFEYDVGGVPDLQITTSSLPDGDAGVSYSQTLAATGGIQPYTWSVISGALPSGLSLNSSTGEISGTPDTGETANFTVQVTDSQDPADTDTQALSITINVANLVITTSSLPDGVIDAPYSQTLQATGGLTPYSWAVVVGSLPAGLSLNSSTGEISGTPTATGTSNFTVEVTDSQGTPDTDQQALSITIISAPDPLEITTTSLPDGEVGIAYSQTLQATGGLTPYSWAVISGSLPAGLSLNSSTGEISGTPTAYGTSNFTVEVTDSQAVPDSDQQALSIYVAPADLVITTTSLPGGTVDVAYSETLQATGGVTPYTWAVITGSLPAGLSLNSSTGEISGTPTTVEIANFTVEVTDSQGVPDTDTQALSITISEMAGVTYEYAVSNGTDTTNSDVWQDKVVLNFSSTEADDWVILAFCDNLGDYWGGKVNVQLLVDSTTESELYRRQHYSSHWLPYTALSVVNLGSGSHTLKLQYRQQNDAELDVSVRNARIVAIKKDDLETAYAAVDGAQALGTTLSDITTLNWTPSAAGDYLVIYNAEFQAGWTDTLNIEASHEGVTLDSGADETRSGDDWCTWMSASVVSCDTSQQTAKIAAGAPNGGSIRRARIAAVRLSGGPFAAYESAASDAESTTTSTTWQEKLSHSWDAGDATDWLLIGTARRSQNPSGNYAKTRMQLDDATTMAEIDRTLIDASHTVDFSCFDVRNVSSTTQVDIDYCTNSSSSTAGITYAHFVGLPLEAAAGPPALDITTTSLADGQIDVAYSETLQATGGVTPYSWAVVSGSLPAGLSLNSSTGEISGTPTTGGTSNFTVEVTDSDSPPSTDQQALSIYIPDDLVVTTSSLPDGQIDVAYSETLAATSETLAATGGVTPYSWSIVSGSLPTGLSLNSGTGEISGTPTTGGTSNFTVRATDSNTPADTDDQALSIYVPDDLVVTTSSLADGQIDVAYSETLAATGGVTPYSWSIVSGSLPTGLSLNSSTGEISGTPTTGGTSNFTVRATDSNTPADTDDQALSIYI